MSWQSMASCNISEQRWRGVLTLITPFLASVHLSVATVRYLECEEESNRNCGPGIGPRLQPLAWRFGIASSSRIEALSWTLGAPAREGRREWGMSKRVCFLAHVCCGNLECRIICLSWLSNCFIMDKNLHDKQENEDVCFWIWYAVVVLWHQLGWGGPLLQRWHPYATSLHFTSCLWAGWPILCVLKGLLKNGKQAVAFRNQPECKQLPSE